MRNCHFYGMFERPFMTNVYQMNTRSQSAAALKLPTMNKYFHDRNERRRRRRNRKRRRSGACVSVGAPLFDLDTVFFPSAT